MRHFIASFVIAIVLPACGGTNTESLEPDGPAAAADARQADAAPADASSGTPDVLEIRIPDAPLPDAAPGTPDAPPTTPDSPITTPDSPVTVPDSPVTIPDSPVATPDSPVATPDARVTPDALLPSPDADLCGNGVVNPGEKCDTGIAAGQPGACPTSCNDNDLCTTDTLVGTGCQAQCVYAALPPTSGDGICCPPSTSSDDSDCVDTAFRFTSLVLVDPHVFLAGFNSCNDETSLVNSSIAGDLSNESLNPLLYFQPLDDKAGSSTTLDFELASCSGGSCTSGTPDYQSTATNKTTVCADLALIDATHNTMYDAIDTPPPECFSAGYGTVDLSIDTPLGALPLEFEDTVVAATYHPADTTLVHGLLVGFMTQAYADSHDFLNSPLSKYLAGGTGDCAAYSDEDMNGSTPGWYFYLSFDAAQVPFTK